MHISVILKTILLSLLIMLGASCASINEGMVGVFDLDTDLDMTITANADVNPDDKKNPSPLILRLYELKSTKMFKRTNFIDMFERDKEVLGDSLVDKHRLHHIEPGEVREIKLVLNKETKYVGLFAEFLAYKNAKYKLVFPITQANVVGSVAKIQISGNRLIFVE